MSGYRQTELAKYQAIFESLEPEDGKLSGAKVRPVLMNSGLPTQTLGKIWELSDLDKDGHLDKEEMCIALALVYRCLEGEPVPLNLPPTLVLPNKIHLLSRKTSLQQTEMSNTPMGTTRGQRTGSVTAIDNLSNSSFGTGFQIQQQQARLPLTSQSSLSGEGSWPPGPGSGVGVSEGATGTAGTLGRFDTRTGSIGSFGAGGFPAQQPTSRSLNVTPTMQKPIEGFDSMTQQFSTGLSLSGAAAVEEPWPVDILKYKPTFDICDTDKDGFVSGADVKQVLLGSGQPPQKLAKIWDLVDIRKSGFLNPEQFSLAMYLIETNLDLPSEGGLPSNLIPPSMRVLGHKDSIPKSKSSEVGGTSSTPGVSGDENKEISALREEIDQLRKEKREMEASIIQLEADITVKQAENKNLMVEFKTLESTGQRLEKQKVEAKKRLNDLDLQKESLAKTLEEMKTKLEIEDKEVEEMREQIKRENETARFKEEELGQKRTELQGLREEENRLQVSLQNERANLDNVVEHYGRVEREIQEAETYIKRMKDQGMDMQQKLAKLDDILASGSVDQLLQTEDIGWLLEPVELIQQQAPGSSFMPVPGVSDLGGGFLPAQTEAHVAPPFEPTFPAVPVQPSQSFPGDPFGDSSQVVSSLNSGGGDPWGVSGSGTQESQDPFFETKPFGETGAGGDSWATMEQKPLDFPTPEGFGATPDEKKAPSRPPPPKQSARTTPKTEFPPADPFASQGVDPFANTGTSGSDSFANFDNFANFS